MMSDSPSRSHSKRDICSTLSAEIVKDINTLMKGIQQQLYHENTRENNRSESRTDQSTHSKSKCRNQELSRKLTYYLRHNAVKAGLKIRSDGYVKVNDLLRLHYFQKKRVSFENIKYEVDTNDKKRFSMIQEKEEWFVRANQGHSMQCVNTEELLTIITWNDMDKFPVICHGTYVKYWDSIRKEGLNRMKRNHIHFVPSDSFGGSNVISGMRYSCQLLIYVNLKAALKDGIKFYVSDNNVILSSGINGVLPPQYFLKFGDFRS